MKEKFFQNFFHYGASMAPYAKSTDWPMEEWDDDLAMMKKLHFTTARVFLAWDRVEIREGEFDWSRQDYFLDCAQKHGIKVILNVGGVFQSLQGIYPPRYLRRFHYHPRLPDPGRPAYNDGPCFTVCSDNPDYAERALAFIAGAVRRYAAHPALCGWMSWNEPNNSRFCYCPATVAKFHTFLKRKYQGDIAALNRVWGTEFPVDFADFEELAPPDFSGFIGGLNPSADWLEFNQELMMDKMQAVYRTIRENDSRGLPVTGNLCFGNVIEAVRVGMIPERFRDCFDIAGCSFYTVCGWNEGESDVDLFRSALRLDAHRWVSGDPLKRTLVLETEAGCDHASITPLRRRFNNYIALGHNAKSIILWNYRSRISDNQVGNYNLMAWDGSETERARYHAGWAEVWQHHAELINGASVVGGRAAVLFDNRLRRASVVSRSNDWDETGWEGAVKLLWDLNIPLDAWMPAHGALDPEKYRLLLIPAAEFMCEELAAAIAEYVREGGTVLAETPFAFKDLNNMLCRTTPNFGLDQVFGVSINDRECRETAPQIRYPAGEAPVYFFWSRCNVSSAEILVRYSDGTPFLTANRYGKGRAVLAGSEIFSQYIKSPSPAASEYLRKLVLECDVHRTARLFREGRELTAAGLEVSHLRGGEGDLVIIANYSSGNGVTCRVELSCGNENFRHLETGEAVDLEREITLPPLEVLPLVRTRKSERQ